MTAAPQRTTAPAAPPGRPPPLPRPLRAAAALPPSGREAAPDPTPTPESARRAFVAFVERLGRDARAVGLHDVDADGVSAGVVWQRAFERAGLREVVRLAPDRSRDPWSVENQARVAAARPDAVFVMDLGSRPGEPLAPGAPACFIDHHRPGGVGPGDVLVSAYTWEPAPCTSLLVYELCGAVADVSDLDWVAAVGAVSDLGERAPFDVVRRARERYTLKYLREAAALVNAARRASRFDPEAAARAMLSHPGPRELVNSDGADVALLREARAEVQAALAEGRKAAPVFSGRVALVRVASPCQIHPLLAQSWRSRLPGHVVLVANEGYLPGRVNFAGRSAGASGVLDLLRSIDLSPGEGTYAGGHDHASGGSLPPARWNELLAKLGFPPTIFAGAR